MTKKILFLFVFVFLAMPLVSALTTEVNVKTLENHKVFVTIQDPSTLSSISSMNAMSDGNGKITLVVDSGKEDEINIIVKITNNGVKIALQKFENQPNGIAAYYLLTDREVEEDYKSEFLEISDQEDEVVNDTSNDSVVEDTVTEETTEEATEDDGKGIFGGFLSFFTGLSTSVGEKVFSKTTYYILGAIVVGLLIFIIIKKAPAFNLPSVMPKRDGLSVAEKRLASAEAEIRRLKNREKIEEAREKIRKEEEELKKLERGEE